MLIATGHRKVQTDTMKAYRKRSRKQYNYHQYQLRQVTPGNALLISVCILMLPMVRLSAEHVQLAINYRVNPINQCCDHRHHMNISHTPLMLVSCPDYFSPSGTRKRGLGNKTMAAVTNGVAFACEVSDCRGVLDLWGHTPPGKVLLPVAFEIVL